MVPHDPRKHQSPSAPDKNLIPVYCGVDAAKEACFLAGVRAIGRQGGIWKLLLLKDQG